MAAHGRRTGDRRGRVPQRSLLAERRLRRRSAVVGSHRLGPGRAGAAAPRSRLGCELLGCPAPRRPVRGVGRARPTGVASACARSATAMASTREQRVRLLDVDRARRRARVRRPPPSGVGTSDARAGARCGIGDEDRYLLARAGWFEAHRDELARWLALRPITVLVSASGAPGTAALLRALRSNGEREVRLVGTDMSERAVGRHLCDAFHLVPRGLRPRLSRRDARRRGAGGCRLRAAAVVLRPAGPRRAPRQLPGAGARLGAGHDPPLERQGGDLRAAAPHRRPRTRVPARERRSPGGGGGPRARLPGPPGVLQARVLLGLARLPRARPDRRPGAPAPARAARLRRDAPRGGARAPARRRWARPARDGARDGRRAHDRRHRGRHARPPRPPEDPRGDARRAGDVLRHPRGRRARWRWPTASWPSSRSSTSSTSSSSASR